MQMVDIPVVFTPDENYIVQTCVAILSMLRTKKRGTKYKFYIVISDKFNKRYIKYLERLKSIEKDFAYEIVYIDSKEFDKQKITTKHLSTSAYYRLILADILPGYDRCMYHDSDILVNDDLGEMFNVNLDECYVAGVKAILKHQNTEYNIKQLKKWGFQSFDNYIFSGDLIFNLCKIRKDGLVSRFLEQMEKGYPSEDQDIINFCCYNYIRFLPLKYCMLNRWLYNNAINQVEKQVYTLEEIKEAKQAPAVVHFAGSNTKPWCNLRTAFGSKWWEYAKEILNDEEYRQWYKKAEERTVIRDWGYLKEKLKPYKSIVIFGYSEISQKLYRVLKGWGYHIECFIDNDTNKQGQQYENCEVVAVNNALLKHKAVVVVNASQRYSKEIRTQLLSVGLSSEKIIDYISKNEIYYLSVDPQYYKYEYKDICIREFGWKTEA